MSVRLGFSYLINLPQKW